MNAQLTAERCYCNLTLSELASLPLSERARAYEHILSHKRVTPQGTRREQLSKRSDEEGA